MKIAFNQATTMKYSTLQQDLEVCEKYGYDLIEIRLDKLKAYLENHTVEELKQFFLSGIALNRMPSTRWSISTIETNRDIGKSRTI